MTIPPPGQPWQHPYGAPQPGHPMPPPAGYAPPPPAPVTNRIPEDQPFIVRPSIAKRGLTMGGVAGVVVLALACLPVIGIAQGTDGPTRSGSLALVFGVFACALAAIVLPLGIQLWLVASGGPVLALGPAGLWIRTRPTRGQAVWLPWEAVAKVSRRRWSLEKMLVVTPRDPRALQHLGTYTALDSGMLTAIYGSGLVSTLNFADRSEQEILAAVAHYSAGRCPLV